MATSSYKTQLVIVFQNGYGKSATLNITDPKDSITKSQVETFAQYIIDNQLFAYGGSFLSTLKEYYIRTSDIIIDEVPAA